MKIIDLGHGRKLKDLRLADSQLRGNPLTAPPEVLFNDGKLTHTNEKPKGADFRADVWSIGVLLFYMVTGVFPFNGYDPNTDRQTLDYL